MASQQTAVALPRQSANHRATSPAFAVAEAVQEAAVRGTLAIGLAGIAVIHAVDSVGKWTESRYMFWMYMALIASSVGVGAAVLFSRSRRAVGAAAAFAAIVLAAFVVDRTLGLPNATGDIGNWTEPLGLASMVVEGLVIAVGLGGLRTAGAAAKLTSV
jgi:FtsH-binding integral membrane protein